MKFIFFKRFLFGKGLKLPCSVLKHLCLMVLLCGVTTVYADTSPAQQKQLKQKISKASKTLNRSRSVSNQLEKNVQKAEDELNTLSRSIHSTEKKINTLTTKLLQSNKKREQLMLETDQQKDALAQQLQALYTSGKQSHLRLLLKQDNPSEMSRTIKYFEYMNNDRLKRIKRFKKQLDQVKALQEQINKDSASLNALQEKQRIRRVSLKKAVKTKESAYKKQKKVVYSQEQKLVNLRKQETRLQGVIQLLAKKRKEEDEKHKRAIAKAKRDKQVAEQKRKQQEIKAAAAKVLKKAPAKKAAAKKVVASTRRFVPNKPFSTLRGKLSWPVRGKITQNFGSRRNNQQRWKGVVISAPAGTRVHSIARGKVEFSGRLKGYGYLVIIRHDNNYRSLYAHNRSVYKKVGQVIKANEVIAAVGSSGNQSKSGLYFEIRKGTAPQNPNRWIR